MAMHARAHTHTLIYIYIYTYKIYMHAYKIGLFCIMYHVFTLIAEKTPGVFNVSRNPIGHIMQFFSKQFSKIV